MTLAAVKVVTTKGVDVGIGGGIGGGGRGRLSML